MNSNRVFAILCVILVVIGGFAVARYFNHEAPEKTIASSRKPGASPVAKFSGDKSQVRSAKSIRLSKNDNISSDVQEKDLVKQSAPTAELDAKFATWRDDGKKAVETMFGGDRDKISTAFRAAMQNEEFRTNFANMRELETKYRTASDDQKQGIMDQLQTIRERGLNMLKQSATAAPAANAAPAITVTGGTLNGVPEAALTAAPAAAPAPAPAPVVFQ